MALALLVLSIWSLFLGVIDINLSGLLSGELEQLEIFLISRLPRLLAILCTGVGMSVAGLIMQQLCMNKFVSPTTGATISSAQFGILLALLFLPNSTLWGRALFSFVFAVLGTWTFVWFIQRIQFKDVVMVPLVGIMFGNVIGGLTNYLAYQYEMTQALSTWTVGHFSMVLRGRYELVYLIVPLVTLAFLFANHFNIVGMGKDFSKNLGVPYNLVLFLGLTIAAMITASVVGVVGSISYIGLIVPNVKNCEEKSLAQIAQETEALIEATRTGKLGMEDMTGGTFTISKNLRGKIENVLVKMIAYWQQYFFRDVMEKNALRQIKKDL